MIELFEDIGDLIFGNKRFDALRHFAKSKNFQIRRKVNANKLPIDVQKMEFFDGKRKKLIKGYLFTENLKFNALNQIFDFYYYGDYGTTTTTIFLFDSENLDLPSFIIKPKGGLSKIGSLFSSSEWSQVSSQFDSAFSVQSTDLNYMRMMVTIQFAEVLLGMKNYTIEGRGSHLVMYKRNSKVDIVDMDNVYDDGLELIDIIINDNSAEIV